MPRTSPSSPAPAITRVNLIALLLRLGFVLIGRVEEPQAARSDLSRAALLRTLCGVPLYARNVPEQARLRPWTAESGKNVFWRAYFRSRIPKKPSVTTGARWSSQAVRERLHELSTAAHC